MFFKQKQPIIISVSRSAVIALNTSYVTSILDSFVPSLASRNRNRIRIEVLGYDDDPRELFDIPEVRRFFQVLFDEVDGAFYWLDTNSNMLLFWGLMLFTPEREDGMVGLLPKDMQQYLLWGYTKLNHFCSRNQLSADESTRDINKAVSAY